MQYMQLDAFSQIFLMSEILNHMDGLVFNYNVCNYFLYLKNSIKITTECHFTDFPAIFLIQKYIEFSPKNLPVLCGQIKNKLISGFSLVQ